ncbi:MAG: type II toxin-antitoxin system HicB family antitoxin [Chloroflexi bacterium]|nr:type II toxin-antitoxin system HicB family antitoxin [Chloroflexota bacterium]
MKREIVVSVRQEGAWFVAQALDPDVASQGESVNVALANLREALELYYEPPVPTVPSQLHRLEVEVAAS